MSKTKNFVLGPCEDAGVVGNEVTEYTAAFRLRYTKKEQDQKQAFGPCDDEGVAGNEVTEEAHTAWQQSQA